MTHGGDYQANSEGVVAAEQLRSFLERVERLSEEIKALNDDKRDVFAEAKGQGFHVPALKEILKRRSADPDARSELDSIVSLYMNALGAA